MDSQLLKADAAGIMLEACKVDRSLLHKAASVALAAFDALAECIASIKPDNAAQTKAQAINTASFAFKNLADGLRSLGIIGVSRTLDKAGDAGNGRWNGEMLQQINVNLTGLQATIATAQAQAPNAAPAAEPLNVSASQAPDSSPAA
jgi:hypothetical protein